MARSLTAVFDGETLRPDDSEGLQPNVRYRVHLEPAEAACGENAWDVLAELDGSLVAPEDLSEEADHYLYGTPKRASQPAAQQPAAP